MARWPFPRGRARSSQRIRLAEAVPRRSDRRDLRRQLRASLREARAERKRRLTAALTALARRRVRVASVSTGVLGDDLVEFEDGTRLWLDVRDGTTALRRLGASPACADLYLGCVEPCLGSCWYQLCFHVAGTTGPFVVARVKQYESKTTSIRRDPGSRWRRAQRGQRHG